MSDGLSPGIPTHTGRQDDCPFGTEVPYSNGKTFCQTCHESGTLVNFGDHTEPMDAFIAQEAERLDLQGWEITWEYAGDDGLPSGCEGAYVALELHRRKANIIIDPESGHDDFIVRHELVHVLLADLVFAASNGQSTNMMDIVNLFEERVCNAVAKVMSDDPA